VNGERFDANPLQGISMRGSRRPVLFLVAVASLSVCGVAQANSLSPFVLFWPGILHISLIYSLPATLLVAIVERDFFSRPTDRRGNLVLSLRANLLSTIVGILLIPATWPALYSPLALLWPFAAVAISCAVEIGYVRSCVDRSYSVGWMIFGNVLSTTLLAFIPAFAIPFDEAQSEWVWRMHDVWWEVSAAAGIVSLSILIAAWFVPVARKSDDESSQADAPNDKDSERATADRCRVAEPQLASSK
jgi:hypothetical protein